MGITSVALLTIGQAPRSDMTAYIESAIPASMKVVQVGLLDELSRAEVEVDYAPRLGEMPLVTLMRDGHVVSLSSEKVQQALQLVIDRLAAERVGAIVLMCTGQLPELRGGSAWLIKPDAVVPAVLSALMPGSRIGVILPAQEQIGAGPAKWSSLGVPPLYAAASPYGDDLSALESAGQRLVASGAQAIVLDCMAYGVRHEEALKKTINQPVIISNKVVAGTLMSLF